jgi:hypothetical protein
VVERRKIMAEEISKSKQLNEKLKIMYDKYVEATGMPESGIDDEGKKFLYRCAVYHMSPQRASRMFKTEKQVRNLLEDIYAASIKETVLTTEENQIATAVGSEWSDIAITLSELYPSYMGLTIMLKTICEIACRENYTEDYKNFFETLIETDEIHIEQLLCLRNKQHNKKEDNEKKADEIIRLLNNLPDGILSSGEAGRKEILEKQNQDLVMQNEKLKEEIAGLINTLEQKKVELAEQRQMEAKEAEEKRRTELENENRRLQQQVNALREKLGNDAGTEIMKTKRCGHTKSAKKRYLIKLMTQKGYDAARISVVNQALEKKVPVGRIIEIVEQDYDTGQLGEFLKMMS